MLLLNVFFVVIYWQLVIIQNNLLLYFSVRWRPSYSYYYSFAIATVHLQWLAAIMTVSIFKLVQTNYCVRVNICFSLCWIEQIILVFVRLPLIYIELASPLQFDRNSDFVKWIFKFFHFLWTNFVEKVFKFTKKIETNWVFCIYNNPFSYIDSAANKQVIFRPKTAREVREL